MRTMSLCQLRPLGATVGFSCRFMQLPASTFSLRGLDPGRQCLETLLLFYLVAQILMCLSLRFGLDSYSIFTRSIDGNFNLLVQWFERGVVQALITRWHCLKLTLRRFTGSLTVWSAESISPRIVHTILRPLAVGAC